MLCILRRTWPIAAFLALSAVPLHGQCREARLGWEPFPDAASVFHSDIAIDGDTVAVARKSTGSNGVVTVHRLMGGDWVHTQTLANPVPGTSLDGSMSLANGWLAVENLLFEETAGGFEYRSQLSDSSGAPIPASSVDFDADATRIVVGDVYYGDGGLDSMGRAVVFERAGTLWTEVATLLSVVPEAHAYYGNVVSMDGDHIAVGAYGADPRGAIETFREVGGAWQFERRYEQTGTGSLPAGFGWDLDLDGDRLAVGAPFGNPTRAYVYRRDAAGWIVELVLDGPPASEGEFGKAVALDGERLAVADHGNDDEVPNGGAVFLYRRSGTVWSPVTVLRAADAQPDIGLGGSLDMSGEQVVAEGHGSPADRIGGAYAYTNAWTCPTQDFSVPFCVPGAPNSTGQAVHLAAHGSPFVADDLLGLWADSLPARQFSVLIGSLTPGQLPFVDGTLCLGGDIARIQDQVQAADDLGRAHFRVRIDLVPAHPVQPILAGQTWFFQCYYRDLNPGPTANLSDAVQITFQ